MDVAALFHERFGADPTMVVRAPGRVNLIGEHTDYNEGFVLPAAIDREVRIALRPRADQRVVLYAVDFNSTADFDLASIAKDDGQAPWSNYVRGVVAELLKAGYALKGIEGIVQGTVPVGSGLSSSAALEVATAWAFQAAGGFTIKPVEMALLCQSAEVNFVGMQCGIMDQFISVLAKRDHALLIDCRDLTFKPVALPDHVRIVICDSMVRRSLTTSAYNQRRTECAEAVRLLQAKKRTMRSLRDVTVRDLALLGEDLPLLIKRRAAHVVGENQRVLDAVAALQKSDLRLAGVLMNVSHESLRDNYEVSTPELDALVAAARAVPGCYGSRLTGAGFGGCTVSLVEESAVPAFVDQVPAAYQAQTGKTPVVMVCTAMDGAGPLIPRPA